MSIKISAMAAGRKTLGEHVYEQLRDLIITLQLEPGQMVYENELSVLLGVSRTPIREAFRLLAAERLIEVLPQRGTRIASISEKTVEESRYVRASLECSAFRTVADSWTNEKPFTEAQSKITELIGMQKQAQAEANLVQFLQADEAFHRSVLELAGNRTLLGVVNQMRGHLNRLRYLALQEVSEMTSLIGEHEQMCELIRSHKAAEVSELLELHLCRLVTELPAIRLKYPQYFID